MMEPLSTLALVAAFAAPVLPTRRPDWTADFRRGLLVAPGVPSFETEQPLLAGRAETEATLLKTAVTSTGDLKNALVAELLQFGDMRDGWDGTGSLAPTSDSLQAAVSFLESLPAGLPLPKPMLASEGEPGLYWDLRNGFADISFDHEGHASFFSRTRTGSERFEDGLDASALSRAWMLDRIGALAAPVSQAA